MKKFSTIFRLFFIILLFAQGAGLPLSGFGQSVGCAKPTTTGDSRTGPGMVNLKASGSGTLDWYDSQTVGNKVNTGNNYSPNLNATQTFWVESVVNTPQTYHVGRRDNTGGGEYARLQGALPTEIEVESATTLKSFTVYPGSAEAVTFRLSGRKNIISILYTFKQLEIGQPVVIIVDSVLQPDKYDMFAVRAGGYPNLFYGAAGDFPYTSPNVPLSITGTGRGDTRYGFVYDIQVEATTTCTSARTPVTGTINCAPPTTTNDSRPWPGVVNLSASGDGELRWYDAESGGNLLNTGNTYSPTIAATKTFWVESVGTTAVGAPCTSVRTSVIGSIYCNNEPVIDMVTQPTISNPFGSVVITGFSANEEYSIKISGFGEYTFFGQTGFFIPSVPPGTYDIEISPMSGGGGCQKFLQVIINPVAPSPVDCVVSAWSEWSACTVTCGGGVRTRTRTVTTPAANGGATCPILTETMPCNEQACPPVPIDCVVSAWSEWSAWSSECGPGVRTRTRTVVTPAANGGQACPDLTETQTRNNPPCAPITWYYGITSIFWGLDKKKLFFGNNNY